VPVLPVSALSGEGFERLVDVLAQDSDASRSEGELYFFEQHALHLLRQRLAGNPAWVELRSRVSQGELDYLSALPELERLI
jgi:hypothetical protein